MELAKTMRIYYNKGQKEKKRESYRMVIELDQIQQYC